MSLDAKDKVFLGGPHHSESIRRELNNLSNYLIDGLPNRKRISLGSYELDVGVVGYQASTIMNCANPTKSEQDYIGIKTTLDYVQLKLIFIDPEYFGKGISDKLLERSLGD